MRKADLTLWWQHPGVAPGIRRVYILLEQRTWAAGRENLHEVCMAFLKGPLKNQRELSRTRPEVYVTSIQSLLIQKAGRIPPVLFKALLVKAKIIAIS